MRILGPTLGLSLLCFQASGTALAGDWPQFGGPNRNGISQEKDLLREWGKDGPPLLWERTDLGLGFSAVSVVGSRVYTFAHHGQEEYVVALDRGTGKELWATSLGVAPEAVGMTSLRPRQPLIDGERLYAFSTPGHLHCLEVDQGKELWKKQYREDFDGRPGSFGWTDYPLIDGDKLICTPGGKAVFHVALNKITGEVLWKSSLPEGFLPSHSPMVVAQVGQRRLYVQNLNRALVGISAADGKLLWSYHKVSNGTMNMALPFVDGDRIFATSGFGTGSALLQLIPKDGSLEIKELYFTGKFQNCYGSYALVGDYVYAGHGGAFGSAVPACFSWKKGEIVWHQKGRGVGGVATIAADGHLYLRFADGLVVLAEASPEGFKEKGRFLPPHRSKNPAWSLPVIAHGRLFLRDQNTLLCYDVRKNPPRKTTLPMGKRPESKSRQPDAVFIPSPPEVVEKMLELAKVTKKDVVYDLGCGDGRIVIVAARKYGARGVGIEMESLLVKQARQEAKRQGVVDRVTIKDGDIFASDFQDATVVTLYLLPHLNAKLLPMLKKLRPGTRIVSHAFAIEGVEPDRIVRFRSANGLQEHTLYLWTTPLRLP
jgi:outer membrane protein assembly factor BamB/precorrin-6B methylase 2